MFNWKSDIIIGMRAWSFQKGKWSFLILRDNVGYICSYKLNKGATVFFNKGKEWTGSIGSLVSDEYYFYDLNEAKEASELKYKEMLLR